MITVPSMANMMLAANDDQITR